jgi:hypothetical protein
MLCQVPRWPRAADALTRPPARRHSGTTPTLSSTQRWGCAVSGAERRPRGQRTRSRRLASRNDRRGGDSAAPESRRDLPLERRLYSHAPHRRRAPSRTQHGGRGDRPTVAALAQGDCAAPAPKVCPADLVPPQRPGLKQVRGASVLRRSPAEALGTTDPQRPPGSAERPLQRPSVLQGVAGTCP